MKTKTCCTQATPNSLGLGEGMNAFWQSALGPIACKIARITYDDDKKCWNATIELTEDLEWHKAGKPLACHIDQLTKERDA